MNWVLISDEDKELANLLTGYQDMVGLLNVHKVARFNTQVGDNYSFGACREKREIYVFFYSLFLIAHS